MLAIGDRDYRTDASRRAVLRAHAGRAKTDAYRLDFKLLAWNANEIENYVLDRTAMLNMLDRQADERGAGMEWRQQRGAFVAELDRLLNAEREHVRQSVATRTRQEDRKLALSKALGRADQFLATRWKQPERWCDAKAVLGGLRAWLQSRGLALRLAEGDIIREMSAVPDDVRKTLRALQALSRDVSTHLFGQEINAETYASGRPGAFHPCERRLPVARVRLHALEPALRQEPEERPRAHGRQEGHARPALRHRACGRCRVLPGHPLQRRPDALPRQQALEDEAGHAARQPHRRGPQRQLAVHRRRRPGREQHPPLDHRERLAGGDSRPPAQRYRPLRKNLGKKNCELGEQDIARICDTFLAFEETEQSRVFDNAAFGYWKVTVERPLRIEGADPNRAYKAAEIRELKENGKRSEVAPAIIRKIHKRGTEPDPLRGRFEAAVDGRAAVLEYEPDTNLRDTEQIPLQEEGGIEAFLRREVLP